MAPVRLFASIVAGSALAADPKEAKMAAVNKVVTMMKDLQKQVLKEGEEEAASYNKFACFCKDTIAEKQESISKGTDDKADQQSKIEDLSNHRDDLDDDIKHTEEDIEDIAEAMEKSTAERKETNGVYETNAQDLRGALTSLDGAIEVLKQSKSPALAQLNAISKTVRTAAGLADALGLMSASSLQKSVGFFLQQDPSVPMENYKFHSDGVIGTLETLKGDFRKTLNQIDEDEVSSKQEHDMFMQEQTDLRKRKEEFLEACQKDKSRTTAELASTNEDLTSTSFNLLSDKKYLSETSEMCVNAAKTWDQRSRVRADELSALTAAITIVEGSVSEHTSEATIRFAQKAVQVDMAKRVARNPQALAALEEEAEEADTKPVNFLQKLVRRHTSPADDGRQLVVDLLKRDGAKLKSTLLASLASSIQADPLAKVKKLIQDLIERLLHEAAEEANQKGWCDKAMADAKQKRDYAAEEIETLNGEMAQLEARRNKLTEQIGVLADELEELSAKMKEATQMREDEKTENENTIQEAGFGLDAVKSAIDILDKFYKTAAKEKVDLGLIQKGPADDAPGMAFDIGEEYTGAGGESGGILGMLDVIKSDFERTIKMTTEAEEKAKDEYRNFMTESGKAEAEKKMSHDEKVKQKDKAVEDLEEAADSFKSESEILNVAIQELLDLKPTCVDTGMSYEERVARREDEIESLKKALCVLENYAQYGPDGAAEGC
jgi:uncharacterized coiled-coil DUF342 family protein